IFSRQKILVASALENKTLDKLSLYGQWINNKGEIVLNKEIGSAAIENNSDYDKAKLIASAGQQMIGIIVQEYIDEHTQSVHVLVADTALHLIYNKNLVINYGQKNFITTDFSLSDKGDFHLLGVRTIKDRNAERKKQEDFILFSAPADSVRFSEFMVGDNVRDVTNASINFDNINNKIVCAGFYNDRTSTTGAGIIYAALDMSNPSQLIIKSHPIESGKQFNLLGERNRESDIGLTSYPVEKIILRQDGGAVIVAEASYTNDYSYYDYFTQSFT